MQAKDIMTTDVLTVSLDTTIKKLATLFIDYNVSGAPVLDIHENLVGIVTESDLIYQKMRLHLPTAITLFEGVFLLDSEKTEKEFTRMIGSKVEDIYTKDVVTIQDITDIEEIATIMFEQKTHLLPVLKEDELVGIVGRSDIVRGLAKTL